VDHLQTSSQSVILSICVAVYVSSHLQNKLAMVRIHHYTLFHRTVYKTVLSQQRQKFLHNCEILWFQTKHLCDCLYILLWYNGFME